MLAGSPRFTGSLVALGLVGVVVAGCSSDESPATSDPVTVPSSVATPTRSTDSTLTIGVMLPPAVTPLRESIAQGAETAVGRINEYGGVLGDDVLLIPVDEGDSAASGEDALQTLLRRNVDAIVGPASSVIALAVMDQIVSADVIACSPTAAAIALDSFPDEGLFFRTIASDSMQARAIGDIAQQTGVGSVVVVHVDDAYGRPFADAVEAALGAVSIDVAAVVGFTSDDADLNSAAREVIESSVPVVVVIANADDSARFLEALADAGPSGLSRVIVNDSLRSAAATERIAALSPRLRELVRGVGPQAASPDADAPFDTAGPYAANSFDCLTLIALAASQAGSDSATDIAAQIGSASAGGQVCTSFAECDAAIRDGLQIDFEGPSGITDIGSARGDPVRARFDVFSFDGTGAAAIASTVTVET